MWASRTVARASAIAGRYRQISVATPMASRPTGQFPSMPSTDRNKHEAAGQREAATGRGAATWSAAAGSATLFRNYGQFPRVHEISGKQDRENQSGDPRSRRLHIRWSRRKPNGVLDLP